MQLILKKKQEYISKMMAGRHQPNYKLVTKSSSSVKFIKPKEPNNDIRYELEKHFYHKRPTIPTSNLIIGGSKM